MLDELSMLRENELYIESEIVIIDEGQFFKDLYTFIKGELDNKSCKKMFIVGGLSGDYQLNPIGEMTSLIPLADEIIKLNAYCVCCNDGTIASFTKRIIKNDEKILVGKEDMYIPVCRYHYSFYL
jgi:thymidine kinase